jgi:hypothetical protein
MARRLVRHEAALIAAALLTLAACSKRGCACAAGYAPEIGVADLDPLALDLHEPSERSSGALYFELGKPAEDALCPRLPDGTSVTLNGVKGEVRTLGGTRATKIGNTYCNRAETFWREAPLAKAPTSTVIIDDGKAKLECALAVGLPIHLTTPTVDATGERATLTIGVSAEGATLSVQQAQVGVEGDLGLMPLLEADIRSEGNRVTMTAPNKWLPKAGAYRLVVDATVKATPTCTPARKTPTPSAVHVRSILPFTVTR